MRVHTPDFGLVADHSDYLLCISRPVYFQRLNLGSKLQSASAVKQLPFFASNRGTDYDKDPSTPKERTSKGGRGIQNQTSPSTRTTTNQPMGRKKKKVATRQILQAVVDLPVLNGENSNPGIFTQSQHFTKSVKNVATTLFDWCRACCLICGRILIGGF